MAISCQPSAFSRDESAESRPLKTRFVRLEVPHLAEADASYGAAKAAIARHDYAATFRNSRAAYEHVLRGARDAGVPVKESNEGRAAIPRATGNSEIPDRYIDEVPRSEQDGPLKRQKAEDIRVNNPQDFSPLAHRLRK